MKSHAGHDGHSHGSRPADAHSHDPHSAHDHAHGHEPGHEHPAPAADAAALKDPVCGMTVTEQSPHHAEHEGRPYYFCSAKCLTKFTAEPARYAHPAPPAPSEPPAVEATAGTIYTCPMHPEIRQDHPGNCPKCGMTLEPVLPALDEAENPELVDFKRRFWWTLPLTVIVTVLAMFGHRLGWFDMARQSWIELVLTLPIVLWAGAPFFVRGAQSIVNRSPNMWTLIGLGTGAAFVYSVVATVAPQVFPASFVSMGRVAVYFEAAAVIISLTLLGQILELKARSQTSAAIKSLLGLAPEDRAAHRGRWHRSRRAARARPRRRPAARAARREGAGRRRRRRGQQRARRVDADRRAAAGDQARRRQAHRRDDEHQRRAGHALRARRLGHRAVADRADGRAWRSARARRCSAWPTRSPATSSSAS